MKITLVSPYHGGSHKAWAEGLLDHSNHQINLLSLPARFWKWRMHGGAVTLARRFLAVNEQTDMLLVTDMLDLASFLALTRKKSSQLPVVLYMHENQLTYPLPEDGTTGPMRRQLGERDQHYAFINYSSMLVSDTILFNSHYHLDSFFNALPGFLKHFPEYNELESIGALRSKSNVLHVGINLKRLDRTFTEPETAVSPADLPLILWNQRWEYDKNPEEFFAALYTLADEGISFQVALCGQQYGKIPQSFETAAKRLAGHIIHSGYASPVEYLRLLRAANIVISTANHEFFGISIIEAIYAKTFPVLPNRLSYPEILPEEFHTFCLYENKQELVEQLRWAISHPKESKNLAQKLASIMLRYDWAQMGPLYDDVLNRCLKMEYRGIL